MRDETKKKMSLKLHAFGEAAWEDKKCYDKESSASDDTSRLYALAQGIFEDAEKLESVGMDHLDAMLIAMMNCKRKQSNTITTNANTLTTSLLNPLTR